MLMTVLMSQASLLSFVLSFVCPYAYAASACEPGLKRPWLEHTLYTRAARVPRNTKYKALEADYVTKALRHNGYPQAFLKRRTSKAFRENKAENNA